MGEPASLPLPTGPLALVTAAGKLQAGEAAGDAAGADAPVAGAFQQLLDAEPSAQADAPASVPAPPASGRRLPAKPAASAAGTEAVSDDVAPMMAMLAQMPGWQAAAEPAAAMPSTSLPNALPAGPVTSPQAVPDALAGVAAHPTARPELPGLRRDAVADTVEAALRSGVADSAKADDTAALPAALRGAGDDGATRRLPPILRTASPGIIPPAATEAPRLLAATAGTLSVPPGMPMPWPPTAANGPAVPIPPAFQADIPLPAHPAIPPASVTMVTSGPVPASDAPTDPVALLQALEGVTVLPRTAASEAGSGEAPGPGAVHFPAMLAATALHATPASAPTPAAPAAPLAQPGDPTAGYDDRLGDHLAWMAAQRLGHAQIRVAPEHLGPIDIRVQVEGREVRAEFHSPHAEVRQTLESSLPRLRELLGQQGLQLAHAGVGQGQAQAQGRRGAGATGSGSAPEGEPTATAPRPPESRRGRGLLDEYA
ncbi:flagellar hook-length control protein FliK [Thermomonas sp. S9]|uniref:flagellar hook-length control protein FliK n=1 Tax=Thermomonas sp. S9 TaxID=2885203 RepID=UPI00216B5CA7|nr:flagellar hook-length control protein FliK [Thermomonas sp. S9]MCR6496385.1 flagellar hook-length control protein FliK [Thermomonas sp. S9]